MGKRLTRLSFVLAAPLILALTSCSGTAAPRPTVTVTQPAPTASSCEYVDDDNCNGTYEDGEKGSLNNADGTPKESEDSSSTDKLETIFLNFVRQKDPMMNAEEDETLLNWGRGVCSRMDDGKTFTQAAIVLYTDGDMSIENAAKFGGASVAAFCPKYENDLTE